MADSEADTLTDFLDRFKTASGIMDVRAMRVARLIAAWKELVLLQKPGDCGRDINDSINKRVEALIAQAAYAYAGQAANWQSFWDRVEYRIETLFSKDPRPPTIQIVHSVGEVAMICEHYYEHAFIFPEDTYKLEKLGSYHQNSLTSNNLQ